MTVPLFISRVQFEKRKTFPRARGPWALDSGGFTQLNQPPHRWTLPVDEYADVVALYASEVGNLAWAAPQDWMCEPWIVERTGLSVREHQDLTAAPLVGLGTVCRRQATPEIARIVGALAGRGLRLHGFGMKSRGLARVAHLLESADSMAWSTRGRMAWQHEQRQLCDGGHRGSCANCSAWALRWRDGVVDGMGLFGVPSEVPAGLTTRRVP